MELDQFAVQVLDHNCFTISRPLRMLGPTLAKIKLIERQGFKVMTVPFFDWDQCQDLEEQAKYIKYRISQLEDVYNFKLSKMENLAKINEKKGKIGKKNRSQKNTSIKC
eukprot:TRINITY_DN7352_c0_g2_i5.p2 TRINITY_DN7352_c0_g2~~TRINITY_DN7352_c0_g2_i5.p2  ORF type:complete len:109 (+),score=13.01 TRINITY_DN7352_c0_g2_i5:3-329(+)